VRQPSVSCDFKVQCNQAVGLLLPVDIVFLQPIHAKKPLNDRIGTLVFVAVTR
jgi:hypothetical protein